MQADQIADTVKQIINIVPTITLCGVVWTAAKVISKVNFLNLEVRRLRYKVHKLNNIITVVTGKTAMDLIEEEDDEKEV
jgi:hypothetical protein